jgi:uncharacterized protein (TIGR02302 family)
MNAPLPLPPVPPGLGRARLLSRLVLAFEHLWVALWPPLGVAGVLVLLALTGVLPVLPPLLHLALLAAFGLTILLLVVRAARAWRWPTRIEADRRLEQVSGLAHRPLAALSDRPATSGGEALWQAHLARALADLQRIRVGVPHPGLPRHDQRALRVALAVALIAALVIAGPDAPGRLSAGLWPRVSFALSSAPTELHAWVTPPAYTRLAPIFLNPAGGSVTVPKGSELHLALSGGAGRPSLVFAGHSEPFRVLDAASFAAERPLETGGRLEVRRHGWQLSAWEITVLEPRPPRVNWAGHPGKAPRSLLVRFPWRAADDYGVTKLAVELRLAARPDLPPVRLNIPLAPGLGKDAHGTALQDLIAHPWAGLPVTAKLVAENGAGLQGESAPESVILPERSFQNPVARVLVRIRKQLSKAPEDRAGPLAELNGISERTDLFGGDFGAFVNLRAIMGLLVNNPEPRAVPEAQQRMWQLALHMEEGGAERTKKLLAQALQQARDALAQAAKNAEQNRQEPADAKRPAETDRKLAELQRALAEHLRALKEQANQARDDAKIDPETLQNESRTLQQMAEAMRQAAREGRIPDAREQLQALEKRLAELEKPQPNARERAARARRERGRQQMTVLQDLVQRQGSLLDHSEQRSGTNPDLDDPYNPRNLVPPSPPTPPTLPNLPSWPFNKPPAIQPPAPPQAAPPQAQAPQEGEKSPQSGPSPQSAPSSQSAPSPQPSQLQDARVEQALRHALGELSQQFGELTGEVPQALGEADQAMERATQALRQGQEEEARDAEQRAIAALQKGGRQMAQTLARQSAGRQGRDDASEADDADPFNQSGALSRDEGGESSPNGESSDGRTRLKRDPLGRTVEEGNGNDSDSADVKLPEKMEQLRSRAIEEELRRRDADRARPLEELQYIERLLQQF